MNPPCRTTRQRAALAGIALIALTLITPWAPPARADPGGHHGLGMPMVASGGGHPAGPYADMGVIQPKTRLPAPPFELPDLDGGSVSLAQFKGKVVLVNFWATWCGPCLKEMPGLEVLWQRYRKRGLTVLAINVDSGRAKTVKKFAYRHGLSMPMALDRKGKTRRAYEVIALPTSYLIGRDGKFLGKVMGDRVWDKDDGKALIEAALAHEE